MAGHRLDLTLEEKLKFASDEIEASTKLHVLRDYLDAAHLRNEVARETARFLRKETKFHHPWIFLEQKEQDEFRRVTPAYALVAAPSEELISTVPKIHKGANVIGRAAETRVTQYVPDLQALPKEAYHPVVVRNKEHRSELAVPVVFGLDVPAVISVTSETPDRFTKEDERFLMEVALILQGKLAGVRTNEMSENAPLFNNRMARWVIPYEINFALVNDQNISVAKIDIDRFKAINDCYSHAAGDVVINYVGAMLRDHRRAFDFAFHEHGDEFSLLVKYSGDSEAETTLQRMAEMIGTINVPSVLRPHHLDRPRYIPTQAPPPVNLSISYGCCSLDSVHDFHNILLSRGALRSLSSPEIYQLMSKTADDRMQAKKPRRVYER